MHTVRRDGQAADALQDLQWRRARAADGVDRGAHSAGVANGGRVRVPGKGNSGTMGAPPGDLYLRVVVKPHEFFETARR